MLETQFKRLKEVLEAGCQSHLANGGKIIYGAPYDKENGMCPVWASIDREAALKLEGAESITQRMHWGLNKMLGFKIGELEMLAVCNGFDGVKNSGGDKMTYKLGQEFRAKYITEETSDDGEDNDKASDLE